MVTACFLQNIVETVANRMVLMKVFQLQSPSAFVATIHCSVDGATNSKNIYYGDGCDSDGNDYVIVVLSDSCSDKNNNHHHHHHHPINDNDGDEPPC